jgi:predicted amidohydrolase
MKDIRIAAVSCSALFGDITRNLNQSLYWIGQAHQSGVDIVCFPELNLTGYANLAETGKYAQTVPGPVANCLSREATSLKMTILAGMIEQSPTGRPFASHFVFWADGQVQVYRKVHLAPPELPFFQPGDDVPVFRHPKAVFGIQLCYDAHFPELSTAMAIKGADIIFMPHASPRTDALTKHLSWMRHLPARAFDNGLFVVACNQHGENGTGLRFPGNAVVLAPMGEIMKKGVSGNEGMLVVDLQAAELEKVRRHPMRYFFPNRRPELYTKSNI